MQSEHEPEIITEEADASTADKAMSGLEAGRTELSRENETSLGVVSLQAVFLEEKIDPEAIQEFARGNVDRVFEVLEQNGRFTPMIAGEILQHMDPAHRNNYPTASQIKEEKIEARVIARPLKAVSGKWANRFDGFLENKAKKQVVQIGSEVAKVLDAIGDAENPKQEFVDEVRGMYYESAERNPRWIMARILHGITHPTSDFREKFPLIHNVTMTRKLRSVLTDRDDVVEIFAPDLVKGIESFLRKQGVEIESPIIREESPMRWAAEVVAPDRVQKISSMVEKILTDSHAVLPENGMRFKENILALCREIVKKSEQGEDGHVLTDSLVKELKRIFSE